MTLTACISLRSPAQSPLISTAAPAVDYDGKSALNTPFGSKTFTVNISSGESISLPLSVTWHFGGKYSNVDLTDIVASGTVTASR